MTTAAVVLPERWYPLRPLRCQQQYARSTHRFVVVPAGRRSGKTEHAKRRLCRRAITRWQVRHTQEAFYFAGAPTRDQARRIWWEDLKALTRPWWRARPSETHLSIPLITNSTITVVGLDKPQRVEGTPWDGGVVDEVADVHADTWTLHLRPALSDRMGWCDFTGVPEGRGHYYDLYQRARAEMLERGAASEWAAYTWHSAEVLPAAEVEAARRDLDELSFQQEYEASFVSFQGRAYYAFSDQNLARLRHLYDPHAPLVFCLDFNVAPGVAVVLQLLRMGGMDGRTTVACLGEVYIPEHSNTELVCRRLITDWGSHAGPVEVYGDATGGARGTAKLLGSDWDIVKRELRAHFGGRVQLQVPPANPSERSRVNSVNSLLRTAEGVRRLLVDPTACPRLVKDLEGVQTVKGGSGEIDKQADPALTHISDALGYFCVRRFPVAGAGVGYTQVSL
jgi:hypothetical protein